MKRLILLDSGAWSVWNRGSTVDLDAYIAFCQKYPDISYYVNLDVLPGKPGDLSALRDKAANEEACKQGWLNYLKMIDNLPMKKVIPVYHRGDSVKWLHKYLNHGCKYMGISPGARNPVGIKAKWMTGSKMFGDDVLSVGLKNILFDNADRPVVKTHGFGITSVRLMNVWEWYSIDSSTWQVAAVTGSIYIPQRTGTTHHDYSKQPMRVGTSPKSGNIRDLSRQQTHLKHLSGRTLKRVTDYVEEAGSTLGSYQVVRVGEDYKPQKGCEFWFDKKKLQIVRVLEKGVITDVEERMRVNVYFMNQVMKHKAVSVKHIYFAGIPKQELEPLLGKRLLTFDGMKNESEKSPYLKALKIHLSLKKEVGV